MEADNAKPPKRRISLEDCCEGSKETTNPYLNGKGNTQRQKFLENSVPKKLEEVVAPRSLPDNQNRHLGMGQENLIVCFQCG